MVRTCDTVRLAAFRRQVSVPNNLWHAQRSSDRAVRYDWPVVAQGKVCVETVQVFVVVIAVVLHQLAEYGFRCSSHLDVGTAYH